MRTSSNEKIEVKFRIESNYPFMSLIDRINSPECRVTPPLGVQLVRISTSNGFEYVVLKRRERGRGLVPIAAINQPMRRCLYNASSLN